jgi:hypothetical protein
MKRTKKSVSRRLTRALDLFQQFFAIDPQPISSRRNIFNPNQIQTVILHHIPSLQRKALW